MSQKEKVHSPPIINALAVANILSTVLSSCYLISNFFMTWNVETFWPVTSCLTIIMGISLASLVITHQGLGLAGWGNGARILVSFTGMLVGVSVGILLCSALLGVVQI